MAVWGQMEQKKAVQQLDERTGTAAEWDPGPEATPDRSLETFLSLSARFPALSPPTPRMATAKLLS